MDALKDQINDLKNQLKQQSEELARQTKEFQELRSKMEFNGKTINKGEIKFIYFSS